MSDKYNMPDLGLFGKRCRIKHVSNMDNGFVYRIVNSGMRSNCWKEPPLGSFGNKPITHNYMEDVIIVVCDTLIDDTARLERVALKDVVIMDELPSAERKTGHWIHCDDGSVSWRCSVCGKHAYGNFSEIFCGEYHYCPNCGAHMVDEVTE